MKTRQRGGAGVDLLLGLVAIAFVFAVAVCVDWVAGSVSCGSRWGDSGLRSKYSPLSGCLVRLSDGRWLPEDRVREIDVKP